MGLNDKITERFEVTTQLSKQNILESLAFLKKQFSWIDQLVYSVDFKEIRINGDRLEVVRFPGILTPFRPHGKITIDISDAGDKTNLKCEILPYNGSFPLIIGLVIGALSLWTLLAFAFGRSFKVFLMVIPAWAGFGFIIFFCSTCIRNTFSLTMQKG
jgi:hypothetical protein